MGLYIEVISEDMTAAAEWQSFRYTETIGQPDEMSVDVVGFKTDPLFTQPVEERLTNPNNYFWTRVKLGDDFLFTGLVRNVGLVKPAIGAMRYSLSATSWQFLLPLRLVGTPYTWELTDTGADLPESAWVDPRATGAPTPASVKQLFTYFWNYPWPIDLDTFVTAVLPAGASVEWLTWSGSDLEGALNDLTAAGSASAMWWFANDSPLALWADGHPAAQLALHWGNILIPDEGDSGDDLLAGLPSGDQPGSVAPYEISDNPDGVTSILATTLSLQIDSSQRRDATYVRGATGNVLNIVPSGDPIGYAVSDEQEGGTGWVGSTGGIYGEEYTDAPAAISSEQRDAFGNAFLASRATPAWTGTITVVGYDGWHKGQMLAVTDADYGFSQRWFLIRGVTMTQKDPFAEANEYVLTVGDTLSPSLGYALRQQRLKEQREVIAPAMQFIPYMGDLQPAPGDSFIVRMQLATDSGSERRVEGVRARWSLIINGDWAGNPFDASGLFWLSDQTTVTDKLGQVTAIMHAAAGATPDADAANVKADVVL